MAEAEDQGFRYGWTFDSHVLWQEPFVIYSQILAATSRMTVGPMVTNPVTRDWSVTASLFATLNDMFGNRTVCGIGRGDSARRVIGQPPATPGHPGRGHAGDQGPGRGPRGRCCTARRVRIPWVRDGKLEIWMAAYGPKALQLVGEQADGFILQTADPDIARWTIGAVRAAARRRAGTRTRSRSAWPPPPTSATTWRTSGTSCAGSAGWSATTSPTWWPGTATTARCRGR